MSLNKQTIGFTFIIFLCLISSAQPKLKLDTFALGYPKPVDIAHDNNTTRLYIVDQQGRIFVLDSNGNKLDTFLDIRSRVQYINNGEEGLLGLAFHPDYKNNGYFYVYHTQKNTTNNAVYRYKVSSNPNRANIDSQKLVISFPHPTFTNHNGGCLKFGRDGFLYIAVGDGGSGGDPNNNAQNKNTFLGKLLRIDVNDFNATYVVPATNPFVGQANVKQEIWAYGLRNPWRFSFDRNTGDLWLADVGQNVVEEVNFQSANNLGGDNYGWRCYEGSATFNTTGCGNIATYKFPFFTYPHNSTTGGFSITGGFVYQGNKYSLLKNYYLFTDYVTGIFWSTKKDGNTFTTTQLATPKQPNITSFGEDIRGELYACNLNNGTIYKIRELCSRFDIDLKSANPTCSYLSNGSISAAYSGENGSVTFNWSNGASGNSLVNIPSGKYVVTATDAIGCVVKDSVVLQKPDSLKINLLQQINPSCPNVSNGSLQISGVGGNGVYSYLWSNSNTLALNANLQQGTYNVTLKDSNNCISTRSFTLNNIDTLDKPIITTRLDSLFTLSGFSYQWFINNGIIAGANQSFYKMLESGSYSVEITDINGCKAISDLFPFAVTSLSNYKIVSNLFSIYPNPTENYLTIKLQSKNQKNIRIQINNFIGQLIYDRTVNEFNSLYTIPVGFLPSGNYLVKIQLEDGEIQAILFNKK